MEFRLHNRKIGSIFSLKQDENSATFALGWALTKCPGFFVSFMKDIADTSFNTENVLIQLQSHGEDNGYTDIEIICEPDIHVIIEAKKYWQIPTETQLKKYASRFKRANARQILVTLSAASSDYANGKLPREIDGVPIIHRSWADIQKLAMTSFKKTKSFQDKLWLHELEKHLRGYVAMQDPKDNSVYVVVLSSDDILPGSSYTWIDVVEKDGKYFHPLGERGWPVLPPNYIAFRYGGKLRSVHHIDGHMVARDLQSLNPMWPKTDTDNFVYTLGPAMKPTHEMKTGKIFRNGRVWCAIDTLLSGAFPTISEARDETQRRLALSEI